MDYVQGVPMYVVDFDTMPELPITGLTEDEAKYELMKAVARGTDLVWAKMELLRKTGQTAKALTHAIESGVITKPGKYGIHFPPGTDRYEIYTIIEE